MSLCSTRRDIMEFLLKKLDEFAVKFDFDEEEVKGCLQEFLKIDTRIDIMVFLLKKLDEFAVKFDFDEEEVKLCLQEFLEQRGGRE